MKKASEPPCLILIRREVLYPHAQIKDEKSQVKQAGKQTAKKEISCALGRNVGIPAPYPGKGQRSVSVETF